MSYRRGCALLLTLLLSAAKAAEWSTDDRITATRLGGAAFITAWGLAKWDYGDQTLHLQRERWFQKDTREGGADKAGHFYTSHVLTHALGGLYEHWGLARDRAAREAALTSLLITTYMEVGDGFSRYGIAPEDLVMNLAGTWLGYQLYRDETWGRRLDLRLEYRFNGKTGDVLTDYEHARYLVALKFDGFAALADTPLRFFEVQAGYYARGYGDASPDRRVGYLGLGLNFSHLAEQFGWRRTATVLHYYQPPDTTARLEQEH